MSDYIDVHLLHVLDEPAEVWFTDDRGDLVDPMKISEVEDYTVWRIQRRKQ